MLGFDEVQFDYIRYPDTSYRGLVYDEESNFENRTKNINSFLENATEVLHDNGCLASADIFGYVLNSKNDNGIGHQMVYVNPQFLGDTLNIIAKVNNYGDEIEKEILIKIQ